MRGAAAALAVARANGGIYNKAAQFIASLQGGAGDKARGVLAFSLARALRVCIAKNALNLAPFPRACPGST